MSASTTPPELVQSSRLRRCTEAAHPIRQSVNLHDKFPEEKEIFQTALERNELKEFYPPKWKRFYCGFLLALENSPWMCFRCLS